VKIFVSYSRDDQAIADALAVGLSQERHDVFFDRSNLPPGESFHEKIRQEIASTDIFVFLLSPSSIRPESYAMTELNLARKRWPDPSQHVLPVLVRPTELAQAPAYLTSNTVLQGGNIVAEAIGAIAALDATRRERAQARLRRRSVVIVTVALVLVAGGWTAVQFLGAREQQPAQPCFLTARVSSSIGLKGVLLDTLYAGESNSFLTDGDGNASIHVGPMQTAEATWILELRSATGEHLARHEVRGCPATAVSLTLSQDIDVTLAPR
jgi:hypothetical protein